MTRREIFESALHIIHARHQQALSMCNMRKNEIYSKLPQIKQLEQNLALTSIKLSKIILSKKENPTITINQIMQQNMITQEQIQNTLVTNGFGKNDLFPNYYCSKCSDTGYVLGERCQCFKDLVKKIASEDFNNNSAIGDFSFNDFSLKYYSQTPSKPNSPSDYQIMSQIYNFCKTYADTFSKASPSVLMMGNTGLGKTHLSIAIANELIKKDFIVLYGNAQEFFTKIQNEHFNKGDAGSDTMKTIIQADLLILDDVGAEYETKFNHSALYDIINSRLNRNKPSILNTNLTLKQIEARYSNRVASRLATLYKCLKFVGVDVRQLKLK